MKKIFLIIPVIVLLLGFTINRIIDQKMKSILEQINLSEDAAKNMIWSNCSGPAFWYPNPKQLKDIASGEKVSIVNTVGKYVKEYSTTKEFLQKYDEYRENQKPTPPQKPKTMKELKEEQRKGLTESIANMKETKKSLAADQQQMFDETIKTLEEQLKSIDDPDNPMFNPEYEKMSMQFYDQQMELHKQKIAEWEKEYPVNNPSGVIKNWLNKFLDETKDIDFNAKLKENQYKQKVFVNQDYERKSSIWKLCFRAGKEAADASRTFAQAWLKEIR